MKGKANEDWQDDPKPEPGNIMSDDAYVKRMEELAKIAEGAADPPPPAPTEPPPAPTPEDPRLRLARVTRALHRDHLTSFSAATQVDLLKQVLNWTMDKPGVVLLDVASDRDDGRGYWAEVRYIEP